MCIPVPQDCPYPECDGTVTFPEDICPNCGLPIEWIKDPRPGGVKPIPPGTIGS
ncbi:MAG: hypothetical protein KAU20_03500 [Nanoarchaeota archaeon]|nr:hypothetical protein [Nanoarchaeota archaeon]